MLGKNIIYHTIGKGSVDSILKEGLKVGKRGEEGQDDNIIESDAILDDHIPKGLQKAGVSRGDNVYGYVAVGVDKVVRITDGEVVPVPILQMDDSKVVLKVTVDPWHCYVSDLDAFDAIRQAIEQESNKQDLMRLIEVYWSKMIVLTEFKLGQFRRPEVMVTYDVAPHDVVPYE